MMRNRRATPASKHFGVAPCTFIHSVDNRVSGFPIFKAKHQSMTQVQTAPYGSWKSPITSDLIVKESIGLGQVKMDGDDIYWIEMRPSEGGRQVIVRRTSDGRTVDVNPPG